MGVLDRNMVTRFFEFTLDNGFNDPIFAILSADSYCVCHCSINKQRESTLNHGRNHKK